MNLDFRSPYIHGFFTRIKFVKLSKHKAVKELFLKIPIKHHYQNLFFNKKDSRTSVFSVIFLQFFQILSLLFLSENAIAIRPAVIYVKSTSFAENLFSQKLGLKWTFSLGLYLDQVYCYSILQWWVEELD